MSVCGYVQEGACAPGLGAAQPEGTLALFPWFLYLRMAFAYHHIIHMLHLTAFEKLVYFGGYILRLLRCVNLERWVL